MLLYSEGLNQDVSTMIREVWLPEGQQKLKQRERQSRRMQSQLKALSFGDGGGLGDPLGVDTVSTGRQRRRTAVNYSEAAYDQQINEAIRESNRSYRRRGARVGALVGSLLVEDPTTLPVGRCTITRPGQLRS